MEQNKNIKVNKLYDYNKFNVVEDLEQKDKDKMKDGIKQKMKNHLKKLKKNSI